MVIFEARCFDVAAIVALDLQMAVAQEVAAEVFEGVFDQGVVLEGVVPGEQDLDCFVRNQDCLILFVC